MSQHVFRERSKINLKESHTERANVFNILSASLSSGVLFLALFFQLRLAIYVLNFSFSFTLNVVLRGSKINFISVFNIRGAFSVLLRSFLLKKSCLVADEDGLIRKMEAKLLTLLPLIALILVDGN